MTDHRSSWVRRVACEAGPVYVKTYEYETWTDRLGNWTRWTAPWRRSRAAREASALGWLDRHGFAAPLALAVFEWRTAGFLRRATLVTAAHPGEPADRALAACADDPERRRAIADAIVALLRALHARGFRDGNFDLRNLLISGAPPDLSVAKLDSPRYRVVAPGRAEDRRARADWQRLRGQLEAFGVAAERPQR